MIQGPRESCDGAACSMPATTVHRIKRARGTADPMVHDFKKPVLEGKGDTEVNNIGSNALEFIQDKIAHAAEVPGHPSGFPELDRSIQGFQGGRLYVVGARKKTGKSMVLLNWAKHLSLDKNIPVLWISTEHSQTDEFSRLHREPSRIQSE